MEQKFKKVFALLNQMGRNKELREILHSFTCGKTDKLSVLTDDEFNAFVSMLKSEERVMNESMRKAIIGELASIGWTTMEDKPDMDRINKFIKAIGSNNPKKRTVGQLTNSELQYVLTQVRAITKKEREKQALEDGKWVKK